MKHQDEIILSIINHVQLGSDLPQGVEILKVMDLEKGLKDYFQSHKSQSSEYTVEPQLAGLIPVAPFSLTATVINDNEIGILALPEKVIEYKFNDKTNRIRTSALWFLFESIEIAYAVRDYFEPIINGGELINNHLSEPTQA